MGAGERSASRFFAPNPKITIKNNNPMEKKLTQEQRLLYALQQGIGVTPIYALQALGIYRLSARIFDLREKGYDIKTSMKTVKTAFGDTADVAVYRLEE